MEPTIPAGGDFRSPLLDWLAAMRKSAALIGACLALGAIAGFAFAYASVSSFRYESSAVVFVEPDYIELTLAASMGAPIDRFDRALTDAMLFASVAKSDPVLSAVLEEAAKRRGDLAREVRETGSLAAYVREFRKNGLSFEYEIRNPETTVRVTASSPELAQELLRGILANGSERFETIRRQKIEDGLALVRDKINPAIELITKAEGDYAAFANSEGYTKDLAKKTALEQEIERGRRQLTFLRTSEFAHSQALLVERPSVLVMSPASLAASGETVPRRWGLWSGLGAALGLAVALMWVAGRMHRETMRELNPGRYGAAQ